MIAFPCSSEKFKNNARLVILVECVGLVVGRAAVFLWSRCCELPTASLANQALVVLWVLTGTHPCDTSIQAGWWRYQSASCYVRCACAGVVVYVIVPERGCFVVSCCLVSANQEKNTNTISKTN